MYYTEFRHLKSQLKELHVLLACDEDHKRVFPKVPIIGLKYKKNLKSHLEREILAQILMRLADADHAVEKDLIFQLCSYMKNTSTFKSKNSNEVYQITINVNCNSKIVAYLIDCRICGKRYNGSTVTKFPARANNYKNTHPLFQREQKLSNQARNQKRFQEHFLQNSHNRICGLGNCDNRPC